MWPPRLGNSAAGEVGRQGILNALEAQMPRHTFRQPVPVVVRIEWADDGMEQLETEALGWTDRHVYVRLPGGSPRFGWTPRT